MIRNPFARIAAILATLSLAAAPALPQSRIRLETQVQGTLPAANGGTGNTSGQAASTASAVTFNASGGAAAGTTFNGSVPVTVSTNTIGAQPALVSGSTIKTVNGTSLLGAGDVAIPAGATGPQGPAGAAGATGATGPAGPGVPTGGTAGQALTKIDGTNYNTQWTTLGGGSGTVTSVAALTLGTAGTDLTSSVANGTTAPAITLNVPTASATSRGALSAADWSAFNSKQATLVSGTSLKTIGGVSLLGSGDVSNGVTSVGGTGTVSGLSLSGTVTSTGNLTLGGTLAVLPSNFASQTANTVLAAPNGAAGVPTFRPLVAADIPTLNQNTTGTADNVTGIVAVANGGTGTATPGLVAGANVTVSGTWPNQTIAASGGGGGGTPGGSSGQVQFNDGGSFGGDAGLTYNKTTDVLTVTGGITAGTSTFSGVSVSSAGVFGGPIGWPGSPSWGGIQQLNMYSGSLTTGFIQWNNDLFLYRQAAGHLFLRNGTNAQTISIAGTYTDASNQRRISISMTTAGVGTIAPAGAGTGATGNVLYVSSGLTTVAQLLPASANVGAEMVVTDATSTTVGTVVAGGGGQTVFVKSNGTDWKITGS